MHLPGVGRNLQDHLMVPLNLDVAPGQGMEPLAPLWPSSWLALALRGEGPLDSSGCGGLAHVRTEAQEEDDKRSAAERKTHLCCIQAEPVM